MPEGPQVAKSANLINHFSGSTILFIRHPPSRVPWELSLPINIVNATSKGKNIFITLANGTVIYNHMLMWGSWRTTLEAIGKKRLNTGFITNRGSLGYFGGGILKHITHEQALRIQSLIGPEVLKSRNPSAAFEYLYKDSRAIGEALLDQAIVAGVGNIYKSEGLFVAHLNPLVPANQITSEKYQKLFDFLHPQMIADITRSGPINTTGQKTIPNFVYRRNGQPCFFCNTKIMRIYQGAALKRSTYFCPVCQPFL